MANHRGRSQKTEEESSYLDAAEGEMCPICHQEFADGICPIASAACPYLKDDAEEDEEEEDPDFEDVENLDEVLDEDKEADRLTEEEEEIPPEDLAGEDGR